MKITQELKAFAVEQAGKRCECTGKNCRHHLRGARCKRGLRGDQWKVYWKAEDGGVTRDNIEAWCLECFANNFQAPRESVALLALDIVGYSRLLGEDQWKALTLKSALRDAARRAARELSGSVVLNRAEDDVLLRFGSSPTAVEAARRIASYLRDVTVRLQVESPGIHGAIHCGDVTKWRNGLIVGDTVEIAARIRDLAALGQIVLTEEAAGSVAGDVPLDPFIADVPNDPSVGKTWALRL
ncbi:MAG: hypothetical protein AB7T31_17740 [Gemmatimonadales bacterium]